MYVYTYTLYIHMYIYIYICIYIIYYHIIYSIYIYFVHHPLCFSKWMCFVGFLDLMGIRRDSNLWIHAEPNKNWGYVTTKRKRGAIVAVWQCCRVEMLLMLLSYLSRKAFKQCSVMQWHVTVNHCHLSWLVVISHEGQLPIVLLSTVDDTRILLQNFWSFPGRTTGTVG